MSFLDEIKEMWHRLSNPWQSVVVIVLGLLLYYFLRFVLLRKMSKIAASTANDIDDRMIHFIDQFIGIIVVFLSVIAVLKVNGISISPLLAGAGIFGVALGFAAKETIADFLAGIFLIADRPVRIGDRVKIENIGRHWGSWGDVIDIGLRRTTIRNTDGVVINYPNAVLANSVITNFSYEDKPVRVRVRFQVDYRTDIDKAKEVAVKAIESTGLIIPQTAQIVVRSLWDDNQGHLLAGVLMEARYIINDVRKRTTIRSEVLEEILKAMKNNDISMASPKIRVAQN